MSFGERLKHYRVKNHITLRELSEHLKVSISYLSDLEHDRKRAPKLELVLKMENYLFITDAALVTLASEERKRVPPEQIRIAQKNPTFVAILIRLMKMKTEQLEAVLQDLKSQEA